MMATNDDVVQSTGDFYTNTTQYNQLCYVVRQIVEEMLNTAAIVSVGGVEGGGTGSPAGYVSATPLVCQTDARGNALPMAAIPKLRFFRYQAGKAAIILDPVAGDQGVAVFFKQDHSGVADGAKSAVVPGSFRAFDQSDGVVLSGVQNQAPTVWIELTQEEKITIHAPEGVTIETDKAVDVTAGTKISLTAPTIEMNGAITSNDASGGSSGTMQVNGTLKVNDIVVNTHTHTCPDGETSGPH